MQPKFKFIPLNCHWVAIHPKPIGVIYFIGGTFFGSFPTIFYRYLLQKIFQEGYTIIAIPYRFTFRHWTVAIQMAKDLVDLRRAIYREAKSQKHTTNLHLYLDDPTSESPNYFWLGHSLGCKYISLLEILSDLEDYGLNTILDDCVGEHQAQQIQEALKDVDFHAISLKYQPSIFLAPVIAGLKSAIPFEPLANFLKNLGLNVQPDVDQTFCLILKSRLFNLISLIAFHNDIRARDTVQWFVTNLSTRLFKPFILLPLRQHLAPLGWKKGDEKLAKDVVKSLSELREKLILSNKMKELEVESYF